MSPVMNLRVRREGAALRSPARPAHRRANASRTEGGPAGRGGRGGWWRHDDRGRRRRDGRRGVRSTGSRPARWRPRCRWSATCWGTQHPSQHPAGRSGCGDVSARSRGQVRSSNDHRVGCGGGGDGAGGEEDGQAARRERGGREAFHVQHDPRGVTRAPPRARAERQLRRPRGSSGRRQGDAGDGLTEHEGGCRGCPRR